MTLALLDELLNLDARLHDYQVVAAGHLRANPRAGLFLEPGLGKTFTTLAALTSEHLPALVAAPKRVALKVWPAEVAKWRPDLSITVAKDGPAKRAEAYARGTDIVAVSIDSMADAPLGHFRTLIIDESSKLKARGTARWKAARKLAESVDHVWELTGTPAPETYLDLWAQLLLLDGGERLESGITKYRTRYFDPDLILPNGVVAKWRIKPGAEERIQERISDICLSQRAVDHLDIPKVTYNDLIFDLPADVRRHYKAMKKDLVATVNGEERTAANAAIRTSRLSQIASGFLYPDTVEGIVLDEQETIELHRMKLEILQDLAEEVASPMLVFYRFAYERDLLKAKMPGARLIDEKGAMEAWDRGEVPFLLAHPRSAGHGLNLQAGGHTIVWYGPTWSSEEYSQGNARLARQGQTKPVIIHHILASASVDPLAVAAANRKISVQDALLDALGS